jgi:LysR family transcriptional regulator, regulator for bpeEF and oprC
VISAQFHLDDLAFFVAVVDAGGFSAAARALGARKAQVSRRVAELEQALGSRLLERTTRAVRLTDVGAAVYERAARAVALAEEARQVTVEERAEPNGRLRVSATQLLAELVLKPVVFAFLRKYPRVSVDLDVTSRPVDLVREGFDLALRVGAPTHSSLVGRVLGRGRAVYVAAPGFLRATDPLQKPKDVASVDAVLIAGGPAEWPFERGRSRLSIPPRVRLSTASYTLAREAVLAGIGLARLPSYYVAPDLRSGRLEQVLEGWTPPEVTVTAVYASRELVAPKVRVFVDMLADHVARRTLFDAD